MTTRVEEVTVRLREMIVTRKLAPASRILERELVELLGVSRTPIRVALGILESEGLVHGEPNCGFVVRSFSIDDVLSAYDVRSALEGLAVRTAIERGVGMDTILQLEQCVEEGEALIQAGRMGNEEMRRWSAMNAMFHQALLDAAGLSALSRAHAFISRTPLAAPIAIMFTDYKRDVARATMLWAHEDHVKILAAVRRGETMRAEALIIEHLLHSRDALGDMLREQLHRFDENTVVQAKPRRKRSPKAS